MSTYYGIDTGDGDQISTGISSEIAARRLAQQLADESGEAVYLYEIVDGVAAPRCEPVYPGRTEVLQRR